MVWSNDGDEAKMLLDISFPINHVILDQLALKLVDICLDNTLQMLCKSLLCFAKINREDCLSKMPKIWIVKFYRFNFKIVYLAHFSTDFNNLGIKI